MKFDDIFREIFNNSKLKEENPSITIEELIGNKFPNSLNYIEKKSIKDETNKKYNESRNHPRIRELYNLVKYDTYINYLENGTYNYCIFKNTINEKFHIGFGKVTADLELGVKHSIISKGFPIYLSGELLKNDTLIIFNFNSSNLKIYELKNFLFLNNNYIFNEYLLNFNENNIDESMDREDVLVKRSNFYADYLKPIIENTFREISFNMSIDYSVCVQEIYKMEEDERNKRFYTGLHEYYTNKTFYGSDFIKVVNSFGNPSSGKRTIDNEKKFNKIYGMCIKEEEGGVCEQNEETDKIDMFDDLFIQMIYQISFFEKKEIKFFEENKNLKKIKNNIFNTLIKVYKEKIKRIPDLNQKINDIIKSYYKKWFCRYLNRYEKYNILVNFLCINENNNYIKLSKDQINSLDLFNKSKLENELLIIKLYFYTHLKLKIEDLDINKFKIFKREKEIIRYYKFKLNDIVYKVKYKSNYKIVCLIDFLYYSESFDYDMYKDLDYLSDEYEDKEFELVKFVNLDQLMTETPIPIEYLSKMDYSLNGGGYYTPDEIKYYLLIKKYLKYKYKNNIKEIDNNINLNNINNEYIKLKEKYINVKN